jgi:hypothetical protein
VLKDQGAGVVDPANIPSLVDATPAHNFLLFPGCVTPTVTTCSIAWLYGQKRDFNTWVATLGSTAPEHSLTELRTFNIANAARGAIKYGQGLLDAADAVDLERGTSPYNADRANGVYLAGTHGIDEAMAGHRLDALLFWANTGSIVAAAPGYPSITCRSVWSRMRQTHRSRPDSTANPVRLAHVHEHGVQGASAPRNRVRLRASHQETCAAVQHAVGGSVRADGDRASVSARCGFYGREAVGCIAIRRPPAVLVARIDPPPGAFRRSRAV